MLEQAINGIYIQVPLNSLRQLGFNGELKNYLAP